MVKGLQDAGVPRLVVVGLFATLFDDAGVLILENEAVFPPEIRPFARSHDAGLQRLRAADHALDWLVLTPPARLELDAARTGTYSFRGETLSDIQGAQLSYEDLAIAIVDEIETPTRHSTRVLVTN